MLSNFVLFCPVAPRRRLATRREDSLGFNNDLQFIKAHNSHTTRVYQNVPECDTIPKTFCRGVRLQLYGASGGTFRIIFIQFREAGESPIRITKSFNNLIMCQFEFCNNDTIMFHACKYKFEDLILYQRCSCHDHVEQRPAQH